MEAIDDATSGQVGRALALHYIKVAVNRAGKWDGNGNGIGNGNATDEKERTAAPGVTALMHLSMPVAHPGPAPHRVRSEVA